MFLEAKSIEFVEKNYPILNKYIPCYIIYYYNIYLSLYKGLYKPYYQRLSTKTYYLSLIIRDSMGRDDFYANATILYSFIGCHCTFSRRFWIILMDLIERNQSSVSCYVKCDCGEEILEFTKQLYKDELKPVCYLHCYFSHHKYPNKKDHNMWFFFPTEEAAEMLANSMLEHLNSSKSEELLLLQEVNMSDEVRTGRLVLDSDADFFYILKYKNKRAHAQDKATWEIVLRKPEIGERFALAIKETLKKEIDPNV